MFTYLRITNVWFHFGVMCTYRVPCVLRCLLGVFLMLLLYSLGCRTVMLRLGSLRPKFYILFGLILLFEQFDLMAFFSIDFFLCFVVRLLYLKFAIYVCLCTKHYWFVAKNTNTYVESTLWISSFCHFLTQ